MIETDATGFPIEVTDLDAEWLLALAEDAETQARAAERRKLRYAAQWCALHPATEATDAATWAEAALPGALDCAETIGGPGTPAVAAFTAEPFAAALRISTTAGLQLMADALNLQHRLPRIWARVESLDLAPWRARRIAQATASLSAATAAHVDRHLAARAGTCGTLSIERAIAQAIAACDPEAQAERERAARRTWGVKLTHTRNPSGYTGTSWLDAVGDTSDLTRFHDLLCTVAAHLKEAGDHDDLELRKAKALGVIADWHTTGQTGHPTVPKAMAHPARAAKTTLYLHLSLADLPTPGPATGSEPVETLGAVEGLGPATTARIKDWVTHSRVSIRPVLDLARTDAVDEHDPPAWMRETVILRDPHCVFPWCTRTSRRCDLDHIDPYDEDGPPGQTSPENLAPLCRRHHRCKTAGRWRYRRHPDGTYHWTAPHHRTYQVTAAGTITLHES